MVPSVSLVGQASHPECSLQPVDKPQRSLWGFVAQDRHDFGGEGWDRCANLVAAGDGQCVFCLGELLAEPPDPLLKIIDRLFREALIDVFKPVNCRVSRVFGQSLSECE